MDMANENEQNLNKEENVLSEQKYNKEELDKRKLTILGFKVIFTK